MKQILSIRERIGRVAEKWYILEPLYFMVWTTHEAVPVAGIQTLRTSGGRIEYNPNFIENLSKDDLEAVMKVEVLRILLKHPYTRRKEQASTAYLASNITIKEYAETTLPFPKASDVFGSNLLDRKHFELYYEKLMQLDSDNENSANSPSLPKDEKPSSNEPKDDEQNPNEPKEDKSDTGGSNPNEPNTGEPDSGVPNSGEPDSGEPNIQEPDGNEPDTQETNGKTAHKQSQVHGVGTYSDAQAVGNENAGPWDVNDWMSCLIDEKVEAAIQNQSWGSIKGELQAEIIAALHPKLDYRRVLSAFRQSVLSTNRTLTRMKPSRRYDFQYMGSRRDFCTKLLFAVDVSGSVSDEDLRNGLGTLNRFFRYGIAAIDVVQFDTELQGDPLTLKKASKKLKIVGRGGTCFDPIMEYLDEHRDYDGLVIFTDGYAPIPAPPLHNSKTKILWLFNTEENYKQMHPKLKNLGKSAFIKS